MPAVTKPRIKFSLAKELVPFTVGLLFLYAVSQPSSPVPTLIGSILRQAHQIIPVPLYAGLAPVPRTDAQAVAQIRQFCGFLFSIITKIHMVEAAAMAAYVTSKGAGLKEIVLWSLVQLPVGFPNFLHFKRVNRASI
ncbi:hypothetical protein CF319_g288 [Tilletia indica]|nr:hypothetical protein CF319_g288 [Tilletia indica]KAE8232406.1 hypothetical protein CF326_g2569 [Tilletia indica]